ncbi:hypothetical protein J6590_080763 [Homalodisca vitripennis]|nr:hypothetical protein J6590_080763 [Homalodisca vitripennis]
MAMRENRRELTENYTLSPPPLTARYRTLTDQTKMVPVSIAKVARRFPTRGQVFSNTMILYH